ncbi:hypothetical protein ACFLZP_01685 [Patescibacteria group bacterium]
MKEEKARTSQATPTQNRAETPTEVPHGGTKGCNIIKTMTERTAATYLPEAKVDFRADEFDKGRYSDPEYLCQARWVANQVLLHAKSPAEQREVKQWIWEQGVTHNGQHEEILFAEEVDLILKHRLSYPEP